MIIINLDKNIIKLLSLTYIICLFPILSYSQQSDISIDPTFTYEEDGFWKPGRIQSKDFYINNNKKNDISIDRLYISLKSSEYWKTGEELDINSVKFKEMAKYITVTLTYNENILFRDKLENILSEDGIVLSKEIDIKANDKELLNMTIDADLAMGNDAQALDNAFNIGFAYKMEETPALPLDPEIPEDLDDLDVDGGSSGNLSQTGGLINSTTLIAIGAVTIVAGIVLNKKSDEKGGKHHE